MTDTGLRREVNEDSFVAQAPIFAVADGMGGHAAGDFASAAVVTRLAEHGGKIVMGTPEIDTRPAPRRAGHGPRRGRHRRGQRHDGHRGRARIHLRRARVDRLQHRRLARVPARRRRARAAHRRPLDRAGARRRRADHPGGGRHPSALQRHHAGGRASTRRRSPTTGRSRSRRACACSICSDGLTKELTSYGIRHFLVANAKPETAARQLVEAALGNGGRDNVTVVVVDVLKVVRPSTPDTVAAPTATSTDGCRGRPRRCRRTDATGACRSAQDCAAASAANLQWWAPGTAGSPGRCRGIEALGGS